MELVVSRPEGLYCPPGDFYIDPWRKVDRAVITHAHADHARYGHNHYLCAEAGAQVLRTRLGNIHLDTLPYGTAVEHRGVRISFHPAGHVLGSAQVRLEYQGEIWVASGDYKVQPDATCTPFEPVKCHTFITESTFGLPVYRWRPQADVFADINAWWAANAAQGKASVLYGYSFGKAQRIVAGVDSSIGPIVCHSAAQALNTAYRESGIALPPTLLVSEVTDKAIYKNCLAIAPPAAQGASWMKRFGSDYSDALASGWMQLRGARRRGNVDRGFVLSDHADWPGLMKAIGATGAENVIVTHGYVPVMVRWLQEQGLNARAFQTEYGGEQGADDEVPAA
ncbi:ligase-associated DNA damage response exonuclease [Limnobacter humi]|uniref:Ligase-associated DNA damage response exonuclease n=1 Tax=Limnobacter humi TaxID=1778671 RepID=A0ABT1WEF5_9BURK|nr:ligase-associated DNA damage response exonuclease [Limnobacter humi]MCQ8895268.1 ligase-associated DNA damage response exonuclease [Limnobacter humi]